MGFFYFDESVHTRAKFVLGAFTYSETSLDGPVADALRQSGLEPYVDEFKSGSLMSEHPEQARARDLLRSVISKFCHIGIVVSPSSRLELLGPEALLGLDKILSTNSFDSPMHDAFFDEGIFTSELDVVADKCRFHFDKTPSRYSVFRLPI